MGSIGAPEILVILVVALLVLGPDRLPDAARQMGRAISEMRRMSSGFQAELRDAMRETTSNAPRPPTAEQKYSWNDLPDSPEPGDSPR